MNALSRIESRKIYKTRASENKSCIQCASLNKSSLQSFVTGDEDGTIKIWKIGDDECISSFESNLAITCAVFNNKENDNINNNLLVSGNIGGGIKLYDLNENKLLRNYNGHRCQITDINFFDFNNGNTLIISSSTDTNVKIWDIRSKANISTFKAHTNTVNCVDFSPDGNWIVSGDCVGHTKLWSISTSKCLHEFHDKQPINDISFHPEELVLATASGKVVRFWDLETMQHIARTSKVTTPIKKILFPKNNTNTGYDSKQYVISASNQSLRVWQWDPLPIYCTNNISVHWNNTIDDMQQIHEYNDLICLEIDKKSVIVWHSDLGQIFPNKNIQKIEEYYQPTTTEAVNEEEEEEDEEEDDVSEYDDDTFEEIDDEDIPNDCVTEFGNYNKDNLESKETSDNLQIPDALKHMTPGMWTQSFVDAAETVRKERKIKLTKPTSKQTKKPLTLTKQAKVRTPKSPDPAFAAKKQLQRSPDKAEGCDTNTTNDKENDISKSPNIEKDRNLKFAQFIPKHLVDFDERELIKIKRTMMGDHIPILRMLSTRLRCLRQLKSLWKKKKVNEFMELLKQIQNDDEYGNNTVFICFMQSILNNMASKSLSFRFCYLLLSIIDLNQLDITNENSIITILNYIHFILETFSSLIVDTLKTEIVNEKDISMVDRRQYCQNSHVLLTKNTKSFLLKIQNYMKEKCSQPNIKIDELCIKNLTLIELLN